MKQSHWLLCVAKNCDWSKKISVASRGMKTYSESRIGLRNLKKSKENAGKVKSVFVIRAVNRKAFALNIAGVEKICSENLRLQSIWRPFDSSFEPGKER